MIESKELLEFMSKNLPWAGIAWFGGLVHYIYKVSKWEQFLFSRLVINIVLAGWIGYLCQEMNLSSVYISIAGFCAYPLLNLIETKGAKIIVEILLWKSGK